MAELNGTLRLVILGCDVELSDFELNLCADEGAGGLISSYLTRQLYHPSLGLWLGSESDIGWSIGSVHGYQVFLGGHTGQRSNPGFIFILVAGWLIYSGMCWHLEQAVKAQKKRNQENSTLPNSSQPSVRVELSVVRGDLDVWVESTSPVMLFHTSVKRIRWLKVKPCSRDQKIATLGGG